MLFNSFEYILVFLPLTAIIYWTLNKANLHRIALVFLLVASYFFYAWWDPKYLLLLFLSTLFNYLFSKAIIVNEHFSHKKTILIIGISFNLGLLFHFKYMAFLIDNLNFLFSKAHPIPDIILPLAISFFTFQQIAYLIDSYKGNIKEYGILNYMVFVSFFPQLIAGPIVLCREMSQQFTQRRLGNKKAEYIAKGTTFFVIGLFKKVIIADGLGAFGSPIFERALIATYKLSFLEAWLGSLAYTFQLYFDFSGYMDMAIGSALLLGIKLPINFNSPYKAVSIIDFWHRWHITLSRFLRAYLYIPLGGSRNGQFNKYRNIMATMLLGGLWHGANWTFVIWGGLHGLFLFINHWYRGAFKNISSYRSGVLLYITLFFYWILTFAAVVFAWVFFRSATVPSALNFIQGMICFNDFFPVIQTYSIHEFVIGYVCIGFCLILVLFAPNTHEYVKNENRKYYGWRANISHSVFIAALFIMSFFHIKDYSEFMYFQF